MRARLTRQWLPGALALLLTVALVQAVSAPAYADDAPANQAQAVQQVKGPLHIQDNRSVLEKVYDYVRSFFTPRLMKVVNQADTTENKPSVVKKFIQTGDASPTAIEQKPTGSAFVWEKSFVNPETTRTFSTETDISRSRYPCSPAMNPNPTDGAINVPCGSTTNVSWTDSNTAGTVLYNVYFEKANPNPGLYMPNISQRSLNVGQLESGQTYFWRVEVFDPNSGCELNQGQVWSFTTESPCGTVQCTDPYILLAGYGETDITETGGGQLTILAAVTDPVASVEIYAGGAPSGVMLSDDGTHGDFGAADGIYGLQANIPGGTPPIMAVLEVRATTASGCRSDLWPYLNVRAGDNNPANEKSYFEKKADYLVASNNFLKLMKEAINGPASVKKAAVGVKPQVFVAGYMTTRIQTGGTNPSGDLTLLAYCTPGNSGSPVTSVELYYNQVSTGALLTDTGGGVFTIGVAASPSTWNGLEGQRFLLELEATDAAGNKSTLWPYLTIY